MRKVQLMSICACSHHKTHINFQFLLFILFGYTFYLYSKGTLYLDFEEKDTCTIY